MLKRYSRKVSIELVGGIGNQLFIYFAGYHLSKITGSTLEIKVHSLHKKSENIVKILNLPHGKMRKMSKYKLRSFSRIFKKISKAFKWTGFYKFKKLYISKDIGFEAELEIQNPPIHLVGYFQTYKYFEKYQNIKLEYFDSYDFQFKETYEEYLELANASVLLVHIRLGDYLKSENRNFGSLDIQYYENAIKRARSVEDFSKIIVISDDINLARSQNLAIEKLGLPVVWLDTLKIDSSVELMLLMTGCKGFVIANSTFSWWMAALSNDPKIIVAPFPWFKDLKTPDSLYPEDWVQVGSVWRKF